MVIGQMTAGWFAPSHSDVVLKHQCNSALSWFQADSGKPTQGGGCSNNFGL